MLDQQREDAIRKAAAEAMLREYDAGSACDMSVDENDNDEDDAFPSARAACEEAGEMAKDGDAEFISSDTTAATCGESTVATNACPPPPLPHAEARWRKRLRCKTAPSEYVSLGHAMPKRPAETKAMTSANSTEQPMFAIRTVDKAQSPDPRSKLEVAIVDLARLLRNDPTVPGDGADPSQPCRAPLLEDAALELPAKHCAFRGCLWQGATSVEQISHLKTSHWKPLMAVTQLMHQPHTADEKLVGAYNAAISHKVREGAPLACYSIDRRCVFNYVSQISDKNVGTLTCFCCARKFPYVPSIDGNKIDFVKACQNPSHFH